jgi:hypothetical protein
MNQSIAQPPQGASKPSFEIKKSEITIYAPMIYMAPCVMFLMRADTLHGQVGGGWALEMQSFFGPCEMASSRQTSAHPLPLAHVMYQKPYAQGRINHRCTGGFMYKSPPLRGLRVHTSILPYVCIAYHHTYVCIHIC